jgi:hypothetical protein
VGKEEECEGRGKEIHHYYPPLPPHSSPSPYITLPHQRQRHQAYYHIIGNGPQF